MTSLTAIFDGIRGAAVDAGRQRRQQTEVGNVAPHPNDGNVSGDCKLHAKHENLLMLLSLFSHARGPENSLLLVEFLKASPFSQSKTSKTLWQLKRFGYIFLNRTNVRWTPLGLNKFYTIIVRHLPNKDVIGVAFNKAHQAKELARVENITARQIMNALMDGAGHSRAFIYESLDDVTDNSFKRGVAALKKVDHTSHPQRGYLQATNFWFPFGQPPLPL